MSRVVSHTPVECQKLVAAQKDGGWVDAMRMLVPEPTKLYTWWSYRSLDWKTADKGRRLDHIFSAAPQRPEQNHPRLQQITATAAGVRSHARQARGCLMDREGVAQRPGDGDTRGVASAMRNHFGSCASRKARTSTISRVA